MSIIPSGKVQTLSNSLLLNSMQAVSVVDNERIKRGNALLRCLITGYPQLLHMTTTDLLTELGPEDCGFGQKWFDYGRSLWESGGKPARTAEIGATLSYKGVVCCCLHVRGYIEAGRGA
jgi:hypothetical protein